MVDWKYEMNCKKIGEKMYACSIDSQCQRLILKWVSHHTAQSTLNPEATLSITQQDQVYLRKEKEI